MGFRPKEVLFSPTARCNLRCPHCSVKSPGSSLSQAAAVKFLPECRRSGIRRVGFTGGEPFLTPKFLYAVTKAAVKEGLLFSRIMTNGVWFKDRKDLEKKLTALRDAGYDGEICLSFDALHGQNISKVARFIATAVSVFGREDVITIAYVKGAGDRKTKEMFKRLSKILKGRQTLFIRIFKIDLSPVGPGRRLLDPWRSKRWFKDDHCKGPGNVLMVMPDGAVKPCCGYATDQAQLTIGNIKRDSLDKILKNARRNKFVSEVFSSGLGTIRKRLEKRGVRFPGKTENHCYFCHYILKRYYP